MTAPVLTVSRAPIDVETYRARFDADPSLFKVLAEGMASRRAVPGQLWERVAEQKPSLRLRQTEGYRRIRRAWKHRVYAAYYGGGPLVQSSALTRASSSGVIRPMDEAA